jgi:hypothetical protein
MKQLLFLAVFAPLVLRSQVTCDPVFPTPTGNVTIYYDATQGNGALAGTVPVYAHMGVITNLSQGPTDWKHVATQWQVNNAAAQMTYVSPNIWSKTINIQQFFNVPANETVLKLAFVFRNGSGSTVGRAADGSDIFYDVYPANGPLQTLFLKPTAPSFLKNLGESIEVKAAASAAASLALFDNGNLVASGSGELLEATINVTTSGLHEVKFVATMASEADTATFGYIVPESFPAQDPPAGTELGINYLSNTSARLALYAPNKQVVYAIGDFSDWQISPDFQMRRSVDGNTWWLDLTGLQPGQPVRFQYVVDGNLKIADPLSTLVLDPWNDAFVPALTFPNLTPYPNGLTTGIVSVLQTAQTPFDWMATNYVRPKKTDLVVYELLMRDFLARHDYPTLLDTLDYLEKLGVTAIELMPVNEFDGNINWGYGPAFHKALDKYYGSAEALKTVIDECHQRGMAVILDVVFNQATGASPLAQLYWNAAQSQPAADNPWLNAQPTHPFNVFNDFNHESAATKAYVKNCLKYWLSEFKVDGFRFDLSKGFTQFNSGSSVGLWGNYDASRVAIWKDYADFMWAIDPDCYVILEHFADNPEEKELAQYGMMLWGNMWGAYKEAALGYSTGGNTNMSGISYKQRTWTVPHLVGYMESHDEDRIAYECKTYGNSSVAGHNVKSLPVAMRRIEMLNNLLYTVPGPKMFWQFGELGYDFSINYCENGSVDPDCRTDPKPIRWDFLNDPYRRRLHDVTAALLTLRKNHDVFETPDFQLNISTGQVRSIFLNDDELNVAVFANIGTTATTVSNPAFQHTGFWYEYYTGDTLFVGSGVPTTFPLQPGEYRLYLDELVPLPAGLTISATQAPKGNVAQMQLYPNPVAGRFFLDFSLRENGPLWLEISDAAGKPFENQYFENLPAGPQQIELESAHWPQGLYFVTLRGADGTRATQRLAKMD